MTFAKLAAAAAALLLAGTAAAAPAGAADIPGDTSTRATLPPANTLRSGVWERSGDSDYYRLPVRAGEAYYLYLTGATAEGLLTLVQPDGAIDDEDRDGTGPGRDPALVSFLSRGDTTYFLRASIGSNGTPGRYQVALLPDCADFAGTRCRLRPGRAQDRVIVRGGSEFLSDQDWFRVDLAARRTYTATARTRVPGLTLRLLDARRNEIARAAPGSAGGGTVALSFSVPRAGAYYVEAASTELSVDRGRYNIVLR